MYANFKKPHLLNKLVDFLPPRDRHYPMTVSYCEGSESVGDVSKGLKGYIWKISLAENGDVVLEREDGQNREVIFNKAGITQIDFCFDQLMRPFIVYVVNEQAYYYHFEPMTSTYGENVLDASIKFPRCFLDYTETEKIPFSDVIIGYTNNGKLCARIQRERFSTEYVLAENPKKSMVWRIGRTKDNRFGYMWR